MKRIAILGSTGSIGQSALAVVDAHADRLQVVGLAAGENDERLAEQMARYRPAWRPWLREQRSTVSGSAVLPLLLHRR